MINRNPRGDGTFAVATPQPSNALVRFVAQMNPTGSWPRSRPGDAMLCDQHAPCQAVCGHADDGAMFGARANPAAESLRELDHGSGEHVVAQEISASRAHRET